MENLALFALGFIGFILIVLGVRSLITAYIERRLRKRLYAEQEQAREDAYHKIFPPNQPTTIAEYMAYQTAVEEERKKNRRQDVEALDYHEQPPVGFTNDVADSVAAWLERNPPAEPELSRIDSIIQAEDESIDQLDAGGRSGGAGGSSTWEDSQPQAEAPISSPEPALPAEQPVYEAPAPDPTPSDFSSISSAEVSYYPNS